MKFFLCRLPVRIDDCHQNLRRAVIIAGLIVHRCPLTCCHHIHAVLPHAGISGGIIHDALPQLHIVLLSGKSTRPLSGDIAVPRRCPPQPILPHCQDRITLLPGHDHRAGCRLWRRRDIPVKHRPAAWKQAACQLMPLLYRQRKDTVLDIAVAP